MRPSDKNPTSKNESERLFEAYLNARGYADWEFEPEAEGKAQRPDYRLRFDDEQLFFEVKELRHDPKKPIPRLAQSDPYAAIRGKIGAARKKYKDFENCCCSLVLYNVDAPLDINKPMFVIGAMLGDFGVQFGFDPRAGRLVGDPSWAFLKRGKMVDERRLHTWNTTISAIVVLEKFPLGLRRLRLEKDRMKKEVGRLLTGEEFDSLVEAQRAKGIEPLENVLRAVVYENPYARVRLARQVFVGPFDERYGVDADSMTRVFAGDEIQGLEAEEDRVKQAY
jgi:hypothetical protein